MRILVSAYACEPGKGSEPEVGLQMALIAASEHDVWVITRENNLLTLEAYLTDHPFRHRIHLVGLEVEGFAKRFKKRGGLVTLHWYYDAWQRRLAEVAMRLDREVDFDVVHHATFAAYWTRVGVAAVEKPLVWGPVGGGVTPPLRLLPVMGLMGAAGDMVRVLSRPMVAQLVGTRSVAAQAAVTLVQNPDTARRLNMQDSAIVLPNALLATQFLPTAMAKADHGAPPRIVSAGRLVGWKGTELAIRAMQYVEHGTATFDIYGGGPQRTRLERLVAELRMEQRVRLFGQVPRQELLVAIAQASVLLHPALHDEGPLTVAEALALGTPVVCLDRGGPPVVAAKWPETQSRLVHPTTCRGTARRIASAVDELIGTGRSAPARPSDRRFSEALLEAYVSAVGC